VKTSCRIFARNRSKNPQFLSELSDVLWGMVFHIAFTMEGYAGAGAQYIIFWAFGALSVSILILMEGLSAFLHALRLHW
jgi:V-type H+-transporting ATPase subunit a